LEELFGALVWMAANGLYIDMKRKGRKGWARIFFFWMGMPATWLWLFFIREGKKPLLPPPTDDFDGILAEIRRDKALRSVEGTGGEISPGPGRSESDGKPENKEGAAPDGNRTLPS
jgi:hypothetical protein